MKHFLIYTNRHKDKELAVTKRICAFLRERGQQVSVWAEGDCRENAGRDAMSEAGMIEKSSAEREVPEDADCMIVLGGDGTMLRAVRETRGLRLPMIGVNLGTLGYMTEIEPANLEESLERLIAGDYVQESRMMLNGRVRFSEGGTEEGWALNDIVISRKGSLRIIRFYIYVNGQFLKDYSADGVIVTTPTGSTGYNLSAGGPLIEPGAKLIMLTPICPHTLNQRSIILSAEDEVEIEIPQGREESVQTVEASFDGGHVIPLRTGDRIRVVQSEKQAEFIRLNRVSFLEVLHRKLAE
ncbi:MAG: NAD(+)/NADH kinase [Roseburia sp.]|nr:NAD(+)/NADH kinase [Roseburia sp.]MCM1098311.1 NAD(+)/NADH kinase [Ruminococcus flavefaciens]